LTQSGHVLPPVVIDPFPVVTPGPPVAVLFAETVLPAAVDAFAVVAAAVVPEVFPPVPVAATELGAQLTALETAMQVGSPNKTARTARRFMVPR
jgi:hypothetical protein